MADAFVAAGLGLEPR